MVMSKWLENLEEATQKLNESIEEEEKPIYKKAGRPKGVKNKNYNYYVEVFDILSKNWVKLNEYFSQDDIIDELFKNYGLVFSKHQINSIYQKKDHQFLRVYHL